MLRGDSGSSESGERKVEGPVTALLPVIHVGLNGGGAGC